MSKTQINLAGQAGANINDIYDVSGTASTIESLSDSNSDVVILGANSDTKDIIAAYNGSSAVLKKSLTFFHDFATDGGAIGTINLRGTGSLPANAIIDNAWYEVTTTYTSATDAATIALGVATNDATGIEGATAISGGGNIWDAGVHGTDVDPSTASTYTTKTTAERNIIMTIAVEALTAGALTLHVDYRVSKKDTN